MQASRTCCTDRKGRPVPICLAYEASMQATEAHAQQLPHCRAPIQVCWPTVIQRQLQPKGMRSYLSLIPRGNQYHPSTWIAAIVDMCRRWHRACTLLASVSSSSSHTSVNKLARGFTKITEAIALPSTCKRTSRHMLFDRIKAQPALATEYDCLTGFGATRHKQQQGALTVCQ